MYVIRKLTKIILLFFRILDTIVCVTLCVLLCRKPFCFCSEYIFRGVLKRSMVKFLEEFSERSLCGESS